MTDSILQPSQGSFLPPRSDSRAATLLVRRLVWKIAIATLLLMGIGSATRVMNAGLACPDWPLCYGTLFPGQQMNFQVFLEWFHRLDASGIGVMVILLVGLSLWYRPALPTWMPTAALVSLFLVIFQGILGGLTVTELLRFDIVTAHLGTALLFFSTLLIIGTSLLPVNPVHIQAGERRYKASQGWAGEAYLPGLALCTAISVYGQSLLGGLVASQWSLHQCLAWSKLCGVMNGHLMGVLPATLLTLVLIVLSWRTPNLPPSLRYLASWAGLFLAIQIGLGIATFRLHLQVEILTVAHQMVGACLLGNLTCFTVIAFRSPSAASPNQPPGNSY